MHTYFGGGLSGRLVETPVYMIFGLVNLVDFR